MIKTLFLSLKIKAGEILKDRRIAKLLSQLKDEDPFVCKAAVESLTDMRDPRCVPPLIDLLGHSHMAVQFAAIYSLASMGEAAVEPLMRALKDENPTTRRHAAGVLGELGDIRAIEAFISQLRDQHPGVQSAAEKALIRIGKPALKYLMGLIKNQDYDLYVVVERTLTGIPEEMFVPALLKALKEPHVSVCQAASKALGELKDPVAVNSLLSLLKEEGTSEVRFIAKQVLTGWGDYVVATLGEVLRERDSHIKKVGIEILGEIRGMDSMRPLISALKDKDQAVRMAAKISLERFGESAVMPLIHAMRKKDPFLHLEGKSVILNIGDAAIGPLSEVMNSENPYDRMNAAEVLGQNRDPRGTSALVVALKDRFTPVQWVAKQALCRLGALAVDSLINATSVDDPTLKRNAIEVLGKIGDHRAVGPFIKALEDQDLQVRLVAEHALVKIGKGAIESLIEVMKKKDPHLQASVKRVLRDLRGKAAGPLILALSNQDSSIRKNAAEVLGVIKSPESVTPLIAALKDTHPEVQSAAGRALIGLGKKGSKGLFDALGDKDPYVRTIVVKGLGEIKGPLAVEPLISALKDRDPGVRKGVIRALAITRDKRVTVPLISATGDEDADVRKTALEALGELKDPRAVPPLIAALKDRNTAVQGIAKGSLIRIGKVAVPNLLEALEDGHPHVREFAAEMLGKIKDSRSVQSLIHTLRDQEPSVRGSAALALGRIGDPKGVQPLLSVLQDGDPYVRGNVASALGLIKDSRSVLPLIEMIHDQDMSVRGKAAAALGKIKDMRALEPLMASLKSRHSYIKSHVAGALKAITGVHLGYEFGPWERWWEEYKEKIRSEAR
ncbi:MAG: HEAT repeat domain-containing protein [Pseudomonadota bacterium]